MQYSPSGQVAGMAIALVVIQVLLTVGIYVWISLAVAAIFNKTQSAKWKAWVPVVREWELFRLSGTNPIWVLVLLLGGVIVGTLSGIIMGLTAAGGVMSLLDGNVGSGIGFLFSAVIAPLALAFAFSIFALIIFIRFAHRLNAGFGQGAGFTVLAILVSPIWLSVLGWGASEWRRESAQPVYAPQAPAASPFQLQHPEHSAPTFDSVPPAGQPQPFADAPAYPGEVAQPGNAAPVAFHPATSLPPAPPMPPAPPAVSMPPAPPAPPAPPVQGAPPVPPVAPAPPVPPVPPVPPAPQANPAAFTPPSAPASVPESAWAPPPAPGAAPMQQMPPVPQATPVIPAAVPLPPPPAPPAPAPAPIAEPTEQQHEALASDVDADADDEMLEHTVLASRRKHGAVLVLPDGTTLNLTEDVVVLGRVPQAPADASGAQLVAVDEPSRTISKSHARLERIGSAWSITDLGSTNGVFLIDSAGAEHEVTATAPLSGTFQLGDAQFELRL